MLKVLVPIDFSAASASAVKSLHGLTSFNELDVVFLHVHRPHFAVMDGMAIPTNMNPPDDLDERLMQFVEGQLNIDNIKKSYKCIVGMAAEEILQEAEYQDLIVMGKQGENETLKRWFGSISTEITKKAKVPVLLIASDRELPIDKGLLYAIEGMPDGYEKIRKIFGDEFPFYFVHKSGESPKEKEFAKGLTDRMFEYFGYTLHLLSNEEKSLSEMLEEFAGTKKLDLVVMERKEKSFFQSLFGSSDTQEAAISSELPLLITP